MSEQTPLPPEFLEKLAAVTNKRARVMIDHILEYGHITTEELEKVYGYSHPPRAARDLREQGIPLKTFRVKATDGRTIAAYKFGDPGEIVGGRLGGRQVFAKELKTHLYAVQEGRCAICAGTFASRYLQIDHRIPYEIAGDTGHFEREAQDYLLLCVACNRAKSWSCEHCPNWQTKSAKVCSQCYWASPDEYAHIALREVRRTDILWEAEEILIYDQLKAAAQQATFAVPDYVKKIVTDHFSET